LIAVGKDAPLGKHRALSTFSPVTTTNLRNSSTKVCGGEKETKSQSNGVPENLIAQMRPSDRGILKGPTRADHHRVLEE
jgi:hypothetical protein